VEGALDDESLWQAPVAAVAIVFVDLFYVLAAHPVSSSREVFVAASLATAACVIVAGWVARERRLAVFLLGVGGFVDLAFALLAALSIGMLLLPSVLLALVAADRASHRLPAIERWATVIGAGGVALAVVAAGLASTSL
jgi:hypothetical protein